MIYCATRLSPSDKFIYKHFFEYYKNELGVRKFFINFNYKLESEKQFNDFKDEVLKGYEDDIIYNIGPNGIGYSEVDNFNNLKQMVNQVASDKDFILTADSDEFHVIPVDLRDVDSFDFDYISSHSIERFSPEFSTDYSLLNIKNYKQLFDVFSFDLAKFCMPKISLSRKDIFMEGIGVGHHNIFNESVKKLSKQYSCPARVNHFRWHKEGRERMEFWRKLWSTKEYRGWKGNVDRQINAARNITTEANIYVINKINTDLNNGFNFKFNYNLKEPSDTKNYSELTLEDWALRAPSSFDDKAFKDIYIHIINECDISVINTTLHRQFQILDIFDPFNVFCFKSNCGIKFVNKIDLFFFKDYS